MFFLGFIIGLLICFVAIPWAVTMLYSSSVKMKNNHRKIPLPEKKNKNQIVISFSYIMPLAVMALLFAVVVGAQITKILAEQGHGNFVYFSLSFPVFGFLIGYLYFKKVVKP